MKQARKKQNRRRVDFSVADSEPEAVKKLKERERNLKGRKERGKKERKSVGEFFVLYSNKKMSQIVSKNINHNSSIVQLSGTIHRKVKTSKRFSKSKITQYICIMCNMYCIHQLHT